MTPRLITLFTFVIGLALFSYSLTLTYYGDQQAADDLIGNAYHLEKTDSKGNLYIFTTRRNILNSYLSF